MERNHIMPSNDPRHSIRPEGIITSSAIPVELELLVSAPNICSPSCSGGTGLEECTCKCRSRMVRLPPPPTPYRDVKDCRMAKGDSMSVNPSPTKLATNSNTLRSFGSNSLVTENEEDDLFILEEVEASPYPSVTGSEVSLPLLPYTRPNSNCHRAVTPTVSISSSSTTACFNGEINTVESNQSCPQVGVNPTIHNLTPTVIPHAKEMEEKDEGSSKDIDSKLGEHIHVVKNASSSELEVILSPKRFFQQLLSFCPVSEDPETIQQNKKERLERQRKGKGPLLPKKAAVGKPNGDHEATKKEKHCKFLSSINDGSQGRHVKVYKEKTPVEETVKKADKGVTARPVDPNCFMCIKYPGRCVTHDKRKPAPSRYLNAWMSKKNMSLSIYVFKNGEMQETPVLIHIPYAQKMSLEDIIERIGETLRFAAGYAKYLYTINGALICAREELYDYETLVCASSCYPKFKPMDYGTAKPIMPYRLGGGNERTPIIQPVVITHAPYDHNHNDKDDGDG